MSKKGSGKDKDSKNKKRDKPEEKEWSWKDTALADPANTSMLAQDVKQLLITRGEKKQNLKGKKAEMIEYLKDKYEVDLAEDIKSLTVKELLVELRLRKLDDSSATKDILQKRLSGEIDATVKIFKIFSIFYNSFFYHSYHSIVIDAFSNIQYFLLILTHFIQAPPPKKRKKGRFAKFSIYIF